MTRMVKKVQPIQICQLRESSIFQPVWPWNLTYDPKNKPAPLLCYFKLFASFRSHWCIQTGVTVLKCQIWVKFDDFFSRVTLKFDGWPWKTIGHLFYPISSFVYHSYPLVNSNWSYSPETSNLGQNRRFFLALWPSILTDDLENNRATLLWYFKLCASFRTHWWIQAGVTVRKRPIWVKINDFFLALWPSNLTDDLEKQ